MAERLRSFDVARRLMRAIPDSLPGKTRLARLAARPFINHRPVRIPDRFGNAAWLPSLREPISLSLFAFGVYEPETLSAVFSCLPRSGVFVDVGANVGAIALPVAARYPQARIVCIEADPEIAQMLRRNVTENQRPNVTVVECLAGAAAQSEVSFYRAPADKFGMGSIGPQFSTAPIMLGQRSLDDILDDLALADVDVVKLDVEGAEFGALQGLRRRLTGKKPPAIIFEFADWAETRIEGQAAGSAQRFLLSLGYKLFSLARSPTTGLRLEHPITVGSAMIAALRAGSCQEQA